MAGTSREISSVMTSAANNYSTRLDSSVRIKTRIRTEVTWNRIRANAHNSGNYETRDNARRTDRASASSRLCLSYVIYYCKLVSAISFPHIIPVKLAFSQFARDCKLLNIRLYNKHQRLHEHLPNLRIPCQYRKCNNIFTEYKNFARHIYLQHCHENKGLFKCNVANCNFKTNNRIHFNKHMRFHLSSPTDTIICPFSKCQHKCIVFHNANTYSVHVFRIHSTDESTVSKQNKESEIVNSEYAVMDVEVEHENEFQSFSCYQLFHQIQRKFLSSCKLMHLSFPKTTKTLAEMCLNLSTHHYASEPIVQEVVQKTSKTFNACKQDFLSTLDNINLPVTTRNLWNRFLLIAFAD